MRRRQMVDFLERRCGGVAGRLPEYMASMLVGLYDIREILGQEDPAFASNIAQYFEYCRENDLCLTHAFADPQWDQNRSPTDFEFLKVVERRSDGIVIRGCKPVATLGPYANEFLGLSSRPGRGIEEVIYFATPLNVKGLRMICRRPLATGDPKDHPLSGSWDEMDASVIFDDVFIPKERVFYLQRVTPENVPFMVQLFRWTVAWTGYGVQARMLVKAEVLAGICAAMADYLGTRGQPQVQSALSEAIVYVETLRALIHTAETNPVPSQSGLAQPNPTQMAVARIFGVERYPQMLQIIRELCGSGPLVAPGHQELNNPEISPDIYRYFVGKDTRAPERFRMLHLAWEYACDSFGSRQMLFEMFNSGPVTQTKTRLVGSYDLSSYVRLAKDLAGISK
jgi:aromatic ring hydroxylase